VKKLDNNKKKEQMKTKKEEKRLTRLHIMADNKQHRQIMCINEKPTSTRAFRKK
jgi:muramoyltetrapeptide carboxypeptidase LdcA involved in peptidoglycan recycling